MIALDERPRASFPDVHGVSARGGAGNRELGRRGIRTGGRRVPARRRPAGRLIAYGTVPTHRPVRLSTGARARPSPGRVRPRVLVAAALVVAVLAGVGLAALKHGGTATLPMPSATALVQVHEGENLTTLAARVAPRVPATDVVKRILQLNGLSTVAVRSGQSLVVPLGE